jgi:serine/threonine protein kinase
MGDSMSDSGPERYMIIRSLGRGAFGQVVEARDTVLERPVAIKRLPAAATIPALARRALLHEARLASSAGRAAVQIFDLLDVGTECWLVMELIPGGSLASRMSNGINELEAAAIGVSAADRLAELHDVGIVHGDIHAGNLLLRRPDDVAYSDFGLAKLRPTTPRRNRGRRLDGTVQDDTRALARVLGDLFESTGRPLPHAVGRFLSTASTSGVRDGRSLAAALRADLKPGRGMT